MLGRETSPVKSSYVVERLETTPTPLVFRSKLWESPQGIPTLISGFPTTTSQDDGKSENHLKNGPNEGCVHERLALALGGVPVEVIEWKRQFGLTEKRTWKFEEFASRLVSHKKTKHGLYLQWRGLPLPPLSPSPSPTHPPPSSLPPLLDNPPPHPSAHRQPAKIPKNLSPNRVSPIPILPPRRSPDKISKRLAVQAELQTRVASREKSGASASSQTLPSFPKRDQKQILLPAKSRKRKRPQPSGFSQIEKMRIEAAVQHFMPVPRFVLGKSVKERNLWMGHFFSSGIHFDAMDNVLCLLSGVKHVWLFKPKYYHELYPFTTEDVAGNPRRHRSQIGSILQAYPALRSEFLNMSILTSPQSSPENHPVLGHGTRLQISKRIMQKFPRFFSIKPLKVVVKGCQTLYIPAGWWHEVVTPDPRTIAYNLWFTPNQKSRFRNTLLALSSEEFSKHLLS
ncbi:hypothetical protein AAMO2058_001227800 [Amorphochlora amoebiformis]